MLKPRKQNKATVVKRPQPKGVLFWSPRVVYAGKRYLGTARVKLSAPKQIAVVDSFSMMAFGDD